MRSDLYMEFLLLGTLFAVELAEQSDPVLFEEAANRDTASCYHLRPVTRELATASGQLSLVISTSGTHTHDVHLPKLDNS